MRKLAILLAVSISSSFGQNGVITTIAGNGTAGTAGIGGPAVNASLTGGAVGVDHSDNIYLTDRGNNRVLKVDAVTGILTLVAGNGAAASAGDNGPATLASLNAPSGIAVDATGNLFVSEFNGNRVRRIDAGSGIITTVAGNGIAGFAGDGGPAVNGSLRIPTGVALDSAGNLYIADAANFRVRRVDAVTGILTTIAGNGSNAHSPDGTSAINASLALPYWISFDRNGDLLISEMYAYAVRRITMSTGLLSTVAGNGGTAFTGDGVPALNASLGYVMSNVASDAAGNLYFGDGNGRVRRVDGATGIITTVAGNGAGAHGTSSAGAGGGGGGTTTCPSGLGDGGLATIATLDAPAGLAFTSQGALLISDPMDCRVRSVGLPSPLLYTNTTISVAGQNLVATVTPIGGGAAPTGTVQFAEYSVFNPPGPPVPLATAQIIGGSATLDSGALTSGSHNVMAIYLGDGAYNGSASVAVAATGTGKATPSMGTNIPYPILPSTPVTLNITVIGSSGQPTGTVQLWDGSTSLGTVNVVNGSAPFSYSSTTTGVHQITAQYSGDSTYVSFSWTFQLTVLIPSTVSLSADLNPASLGANVTFTAMVSQSGATGNMAFYDGGAWIATRPVFGGVATLMLSTLTAGTHSITASYNGDFVVGPSTSAVFSETINAITPTTLSLVTSGSPSTWGDTVTLTAGISPAGATGPISYYDGPTLLGTATLSGGSAVLATTQLTAGSHTITASYGGSASYGASTSSALTQTVAKLTPSVALTSSANPSTSPASVTFTASIVPAINGLTVQFLDGATLLGSATLSGGVASFSTSSLSPGSHSITAVCLGDGNLNQAASTALSQTIQAATAIAVTAPSATTTYGQAVTFTAALAPPAATGTVQFSDGAASAGSAPIVNGVATLTLPGLSVGSHSIQAVYAGDGTYLASTSSVWVQTVNKATASVALASGLNPSASGQSVTFTASVSPASATGSVQFLDGAATLATVSLAGGTASFSTSALSTGAHSLTAVYSGDGNYTGASSAVVSQTVDKAATTSSISPSSANVVFGQGVTLTATVSPASATGTVQFLDGATVLATLPLNSGTAVFTATNLAVGVHSLTAVYSGDADHSGSTSGASSVTVAKASSSVALAASPNPSTSGQAVVFTASVTPPSASGTVQFLDGASVIGTAALSSGIASVSTALLAAGSHSITAVYSGDAGFNTSTSAVLSQTVAKVVTTTTVSANPATITFGQSVVLTATVTPASATGTVQFQDGATVLGTATLSGGSASMSAVNLAAGSHAITAAYRGDANSNSSSSAAASVTVAKANASVTLASSLNPSAGGQAVSFTATVVPATASGTVQFKDGATVLGTATLSNGSASLTTSALAVGAHNITAVYSGDAGYNGATSGTLAQTVLTATTTSLSANKSTLPAGQKLTLTARVSPTAATGTVQFVDGATVIGTVALNRGSATLTVSTLAAGSHSITAVYGGATGYAVSTSDPLGVTITP